MLEREESHEFIVFNLTTIVFIHFFNQTFDVYGHFKLRFYDIHKLLGIYMARSVLLTTKGHICIQRVLFVRLVYKFTLLAYDSLELLFSDAAGIVGACFSHHPLKLGFTYYDAHHLKHYTKFFNI